jgi:heme oxygenase
LTAAASLKIHTQQWHDRIDRHSVLSDLMLPTLNLARYRNILGRLYPCLRSVETALAPFMLAKSGGALSDIDPALWRRSADLRGDLRRLGALHTGVTDVADAHAIFSPGNAPLDRGPAPQLADEADVWGCLYVVAGSALGGRAIERAVRLQLGVSVARGVRFFHGRSPNLGLAWKNLSRALDEAMADPVRLEKATAKANQIFEFFAAHLEVSRVEAAHHPAGQ